MTMGLGPKHVTVFAPLRESLMAHMQACDLNVFASATDGLPMTMLEALYFGQVQVLANYSCYTPPLVDGVNGVFFETLTPPAIAAAIGKAITLTVNRAERTAANRQLLEADFNRDRNLVTIERWYDTVLDQRPGPTGAESAK